MQSEKNFFIIYEVKVKGAIIAADLYVGFPNGVKIFAKAVKKNVSCDPARYFYGKRLCPGDAGDNDRR